MLEGGYWNYLDRSEHWGLVIGLEYVPGRISIVFNFQFNEF